jgi:hypothetical protein
MDMAILETLTRLCAELEAIEFWNARYRRKQEPEAYETIAFQRRKKRRSEIVRQIVFLTQDRQRYWKPSQKCSALHGKKTGPKKFSFVRIS